MIKGADVQYVQRWKDLVESKQVRLSSVRLNKASLNSGKVTLQR